MLKRYDKAIIKKAVKLYQGGLSLRKIQKETGIRSMNTILFHCNPVYKKKIIEQGRKWRKENPERWGEICKRAKERKLRRDARREKLNQ